jgi:hypothetical protein
MEGRKNLQCPVVAQEERKEVRVRNEGRKKEGEGRKGRNEGRKEGWKNLKCPVVAQPRNH